MLCLAQQRGGPAAQIASGAGITLSECGTYGPNQLPALREASSSISGRSTTRGSPQSSPASSRRACASGALARPSRPLAQIRAVVAGVRGRECRRLESRSSAPGAPLSARERLRRRRLGCRTHSHDSSQAGPVGAAPSGSRSRAGRARSRVLRARRGAVVELGPNHYVKLAAPLVAGPRGLAWCRERRAARERGSRRPLLAERSGRRARRVIPPVRRLRRSRAGPRRTAVPRQARLLGERLRRLAPWTSRPTAQIRASPSRGVV